MNISRRTHGYLDYIIGILLILAPKLLNFDNGGIQARLPMILGVTTIVYSMLTRYELGLFKLIPFRVHLALDTVSGLLLALSPWLFQFSHRVWAPHLIVGLVELVVVMMTRRTADVTTPRGDLPPGTPARM